MRGRYDQGFRLARRQLGLKLSGNCFGDIALDGKDVIKWSVVTAQPTNVYRFLRRLTAR